MNLPKKLTEYSKSEFNILSVYGVKYQRKINGGKKKKHMDIRILVGFI